MQEHNGTELVEVKAHAITPRRAYPRTARTLRLFTVSL